ncbi:MAG: sulfate ABC transporter permease [Acidocella sp. 35-58-6]|nr:MAG: sulfate ABC transporter permease [Acidocella sp. 35-58-6]
MRLLGVALPVSILLTLGFLTVPLFGLLSGGDWSNTSLSADDIRAVITSLLGGVVALGLIALCGTPLALYLARRKTRLSGLAEALVLIPMLMPTLAIGILLAAFYGPAAPVGAALANIGLMLTNTPAAFVLAALYAALPTYIIAARAALSQVPGELEDVARTLGIAGVPLFFRVTLPLAHRGLAAALALAWVRAMGEFGIVLIIAYFPQGLPVRLWVDLQDQGISAVFPLLAVFLVVALPLPLWLGLRSRHAPQ